MGFALRKEYQPLHWWLLYICTFLLLSVCLFTTPVTAGSSTSLQMAVPRSGMLIPLYIYPTPGAWDPLYSAIKSHPSVDFIVVINPASGPGAFPLPDSIYTQEITKLNTYANVRTIGYVPMGYGRTPIEKTYADIAKYVGWGDRNPNIAMQGIFLDESPQVSDGYNTTYVDNVRKYVKSQKGLSGGLLVMNPGMIPDTSILQAADRTVVFEERYQTYINIQAAKQLAALPDRSALVCLMHSIPADVSVPQLRSIVSELRMLAGSVFLTDYSELYYQRFSPRFQDFVDALA